MQNIICDSQSKEDSESFHFSVTSPFEIIFLFTLYIFLHQSNSSTPCHYGQGNHVCRPRCVYNSFTFFFCILCNCLIELHPVAKICTADFFKI
jgi:hypothetical protein